MPLYKVSGSEHFNSGLSVAALLSIVGELPIKMPLAEAVWKGHCSQGSEELGTAL